MIETNEPTRAAIYTAAAVLVVAWVCKDLILATMRPVKPLGLWSRNRWLRLIGREDYVGRHRLGLII